MHSQYSKAPCSFQMAPAFSAMRLYSSTLSFGNGTTNPSTYFSMVNLPLIVQETAMKFTPGVSILPPFALRPMP